MIGYHVTTTKKLQKYEQSKCILPPVRFWPNEYFARKWQKRTGRDVILKIEFSGEHYPLSDHRPARFTDDIVRDWNEL